MISCTEFIPLYSEFFKFLEKKAGPDAVMEYWIHISDTSIGDKTNPNSLASKCESFVGFEGAKAYWGHTLTEEACDFIKLYDYEKDFIFSHMRHCPSRGMLNDLKHVEPYHNYCEHCNVIYSRVLEKYGIEYIRDHSKIDNAECRSLLFKKDGLEAVKAWLEKVYAVEEASDVLTFEHSADKLTVTISKSPVIEYMHSLNQKPSEYYIEQTRTLYSTIAHKCNFGFELEYYNEDGATRFTFTQ